MSDVEEDLSIADILRLLLGSPAGSSFSSGISRTCCRAAMSSGEPFFLTCCSSFIASAISTCEPEMSDSLESAMPASLAAEPCLLPKQDSELERELDLEFDLEFVLEATDRGLSRTFAVSTALSLVCDRMSWSNSAVVGERRASLICCRPSGLRSAGPEKEHSGESLL